MRHVSRPNIKRVTNHGTDAIKDDQIQAKEQSVTFSLVSVISPAGSSKILLEAYHRQQQGCVEREKRRRDN